jgi:GH25 family lysozyme M1 (1,4-beta-N-acetylmuramidase)
MKSIRKGDKGDEVLFLQRLLNRHGFNIPVDADFGVKSEAATKLFQKSQKLVVDGIVGNNTWSTLSEETRKKLPNQTYKGTDVYRHDLTERPAHQKFWDELVRGEFWFCFVKTTQGTTREDPRFMEHFQKLKDIRLPRGGYHFPRLLQDNVKEEVNFFLSTWAKCGEKWTDKGILPPVYDVEPLSDNEVNDFKANAKVIAERMKQWLGTVETKTKRQPIIYTTRRNWDELLKSPKGFENYPLWVADYGKLSQPRLPSTWNSYAIWQYFDKAEIGGIGGKYGFDINSLPTNLPLSDFLKLANY